MGIPKGGFGPLFYFPCGSAKCVLGASPLGMDCLQKSEMTVFNNLWLVFTTTALSLTWLAPNHSPPWAAFHSDFWAALVLCIAAIGVFARLRMTPFQLSWHGLFMLGFAALPILQFLTGKIAHYGVAWIWSLYLFGATLAFLLGQRWASRAWKEPVTVFLVAAAMAGLVSVGITLHQWLGLDPIGPWLLLTSGPRHHANVAQANQLGSLLVLAIVGVAWMREVGYIRVPVALAAAAYLVVGVVMTGSRTAWLNMVVLVLFPALFSKRVNSRGYAISALFLVAWLAMLVVLRSEMDAWIGYEGPSAHERGSADGARWQIWLQCVEAIKMKPWLGWGFGQTVQAQFATIDAKHVFGGGAAITSAHNLFLDLVMWLGIPLALIFFVAAGFWVKHALLSIDNNQRLIAWAALMVLFVHSMLELPLHYAYFLLPACLVAGAIHARLSFRPVTCIGTPIGISLYVGALGMLLLTARDYLNVETHMYGLRFESAGVETSIPFEPPNVLVLNQWWDAFLLARLHPYRDWSDSERLWIDTVVFTEPMGRNLRAGAVAAAYSGDVEGAQLRIRWFCLVVPKTVCEALHTTWTGTAEAHPPLARVPWPILDKRND